MPKKKSQSSKLFASARTSSASMRISTFLCLCLQSHPLFQCCKHRANDLPNSHSHLTTAAKRHCFTHNATVPRSVYFRNVFRLIKSQWISFNKPVASLFPVQNRLPILQFVRQRLQICAQDSGHVRHPFASRAVVSKMFFKAFAAVTTTRSCANTAFRFPFPLT